MEIKTPKLCLMDLEETPNILSQLPRSHDDERALQDSQHFAQGEELWQLNTDKGFCATRQPRMQAYFNQTRRNIKKCWSYIMYCITEDIFTKLKSNFQYATVSKTKTVGTYIF